MRAEDDPGSNGRRSLAWLYPVKQQWPLLPTHPAASQRSETASKGLGPGPLHNTAGTAASTALLQGGSCPLLCVRLAQESSGPRPRIIPGTGMSPVVQGPQVSGSSPRQSTPLSRKDRGGLPDPEASVRPCGTGGSTQDGAPRVSLCSCCSEGSMSQLRE